MAKSNPHIFFAQVYYEDIDHSDVVYHANYLKFFERAREEIIGIENLTRMWHDQSIGFSVYKADLRFQDGAVFGDTVRSAEKAVHASCVACHLDLAGKKIKPDQWNAAGATTQRPRPAYRPLPMSPDSSGISPTLDYVSLLLNKS